MDMEPFPDLRFAHVATISSASALTEHHDPEITRATSATSYPIMLIAMAVGAIVRLVPAIYSSFPLGDGGMFYIMVKEILAAHFALPRSINYDSLHVPFDYPPGAFYFVAGLHAATGWSTLDIFRLLPPICSVLSIGAFALLANELLRSRLSATVATFAFALDIDAFEWQIKGGGITRSTGFLFMILFLWQLAVLYRERKNRYVISSGVLAALTFLTHLEWTYLAGASALLFLISLARDREAVLQTAGAALVSLVLVAPWLIVVVSRDGLTPLVGTLGGTNAASPWYMELFDLVTLRLSLQSVLSVPSLLAIVGAVALMARRRWLLPAWFAVAFIIGSRLPQGNSCIALCLLAGVGFESVLLPAIANDVPGVLKLKQRRIPRLALVVLLAFAFQSWVATSLDTVQADSPLSTAELASMNWVSQHTPRDAQFLVITGESSWGDDNLSEWFDAIAHRPSVATVQGTEWLASDYIARIKSYNALQYCSVRRSGCLSKWLRRSGSHPDYLYVSKILPSGYASTFERKLGDCCARLHDSLDRDPFYRPVYTSSVSTIYRIATGVER